MSSPLSAIGVAPIQPVAPIAYQPPEESIAPVQAAASPADESGSGGPDVLYQRAPQWPAQPLTYANPAAATPDAQAPQLSDAIFDPQAPLPEPLPPMVAPEPLAAQRPAEPLDGGYELKEAPEWLAETGAAPVPDTPDAFESGEAVATRLLATVLANEALYPTQVAVAPIETPKAAVEPTQPTAPVQIQAHVPSASPADAVPGQAELTPDPLGALPVPANDDEQAPPPGSDAAILAATDNGGTAPVTVPAMADDPSAAVEVASASVEKRAIDTFAQTAVAGAGANPAVAIAQAAYETVARVSSDSLAALDAAKLA